MRVILLFTFCLLLSLLPSNAQAGETLAAESAKAISEAQLFLEHLDAMDGAYVWSAGTPIFQARYDQDKWITLQQLLRMSYGALVSRQLKAIHYKQSYYSAPDGYYIIVQFDSSFTNKQKMVETVILDAGDPVLWKIIDLRLN